eukprot:CAMPEP_0174720536 /NCGR_PEP_ID=MMETSP1094-20130205/33757_1 /TAXON_ID=156173 /ORGANISM="Chrysochromulina brevifilum, Strain UTEX LB 985" /LENGTH=55 /DNA_ID=CAMNT_0015921031 /DNA_START=312 /DNA_END=479 /DNA_ORIENTATION=+
MASVCASWLSAVARRISGTMSLDMVLTLLPSAPTIPALSLSKSGGTAYFDLPMKT